MSKSRSSARPTGNNNVDLELKRIWDKLNEISSDLDNVKRGNASNEERLTFRFVQTGEGRYLEARFTNGWARLPLSFNYIDKKE